MRAESGIFLRLKGADIVRLIYTMHLQNESRILLLLEYCPYQLRTVIEKPETMTGNKKLEYLLSPDGFLEIIMHLIDALFYFHSQDLLYPDIKSTNILFDNNGFLKLCGFNLVFGPDQPELTTEISSLYYLAPENTVKTASAKAVFSGFGLMKANRIFTVLQIAVGAFNLLQDKTDY